MANPPALVRHAELTDARDPRGRQPRPAGVAALSVFFSAGSAIALTAGVSLLFPGNLLEPMWRLNPRAREAFTSLGSWAVALLAAVCLACAASATVCGAERAGAIRSPSACSP